MDFTTQCDYAVSENSNLRRHVKAVHDKGKVFQCSECDYTASPNRAVSEHEELHIPDITYDEVRRAIKCLKNNRAPGLDRIHSEHLKAGGEATVRTLRNLFSVMLVKKYVPQQFKDSVIVLIHKKGSEMECKNYRPINL